MECPEMPSAGKNLTPSPADQCCDTLLPEKQNYISPTQDIHGPYLPVCRPTNIPLPLCHAQTKLHNKSYNDDLTLLEKVSLSLLKPKGRIIGQVLPRTPTQPKHLTASA